MWDTTHGGLTMRSQLWDHLVSALLASCVASKWASREVSCEFAVSSNSPLGHYHASMRTTISWGVTDVIQEGGKWTAYKLLLTHQVLAPAFHQNKWRHHVNYDDKLKKFHKETPAHRSVLWQTSFFKSPEASRLKQEERSSEGHQLVWFMTWNMCEYYMHA